MPFIPDTGHEQILSSSGQNVWLLHVASASDFNHSLDDFANHIK
jgi:hypothetical protein